MFSYHFFFPVRILAWKGWIRNMSKRNTGRSTDTIRVSRFWLWRMLTLKLTGAEGNDLL